MVYLTGAGCGDISLLTLKASECISEADVIVYDALVEPSVLEKAKPDSKKIYVGKRDTHHTLTQDEINALLVELAGQFETVVRLKGGDPYVFGRGGEEGEYLREHGIDFEVIPGIPSAIGGLAYAGIPVTHRDYASGFAVLTGHRKKAADEYDYESLVEFNKRNGTLIFLMGVSSLDAIMDKLLAAGLDPKTPVALVHQASTPEQRSVTATAETISEVGKDIKAPAIIVIGEVVNLREKLNFYENVGPLYSKKVLITRSRAQTLELSKMLKNKRAVPVEFATIAIKENLDAKLKLEEEIKNIKTFDHLIFTSANAVELFFKTLFELGYDSRVLSHLNIAAIGTGTKRKLFSYGIRADITPESFIAESLVASLIPFIKEGDKILIPRSAEARPYLVEELSKTFDVCEIPLYRTEKDNSNVEEIRERINNHLIDALTFTSSSTVKNFRDAFDSRDVEGIDIFSIGPQTSKTLRENGFKVTAEASEYSLPGLIDCMETYYDTTD